MECNKTKGACSKICQLRWNKETQVWFLDNFVDFVDCDDFDASDYIDDFDDFALLEPEELRY